MTVVRGVDARGALRATIVREEPYSALRRLLPPPSTVTIVPVV
jgi:hypothetical protein